MNDIIIKTGVDGVYLFFCPGCGCCHWFSSSGRTPSHPNTINEQLKWSFNNDFNKPTVRASILVRSGNEKGPTICHSFITDGKIEYLSDCTHELKGKTVNLEVINS